MHRQELSLREKHLTVVTGCDAMTERVYFHIFVDRFLCCHVLKVALPTMSQNLAPHTLAVFRP